MEYVIQRNGKNACEQQQRSTSSEPSRARLERLGSEHLIGMRAPPSEALLREELYSVYRIHMAFVMFLHCVECCELGDI